MNFPKIISEEVDKFVDKLPADKLISTLKSFKEDRKILSSLQGYVNDYDQNNQIVEENWNWFKETLKQLATNSPRFQFKCKEVNNKLYAVKYFTKLKFTISETVEEELKFQLKNYFKHLTYENPDEFIDAFFKLPFEFIGLVVRYIANVLAPKVKNQLTTNKKEADIFLKNLLKKKNDFIININKISLGQSDNISISEAKLLLDVKVFYDYNALNNGTLEYLLKLFNSNAKQKLIDEFGSEKIDFVKDQILAHPSYLQFLKEVKTGQEQPFFTKDGFQNSEREITFDDYVKKYFTPEEFVPKSNNKQSQQVTPVVPTETSQETQVEQPSVEDLVK